MKDIILEHPDGTLVRLNYDMFKEEIESGEFTIFDIKAGFDRYIKKYNCKVIKNYEKYVRAERNVRKIKNNK